MKIGIDARALQTGHKFRGIGEVAKQVTERVLLYAQRDGHEVIFYEYEGDDPRNLLALPEGLQYTVVKQGVMPEEDPQRTKQEKLRTTIKQLFGEPILGSDESDAFIQFDYAFGVPKNVHTVLVKHDLIPLIFWKDFFESPLVPFKNKALRTTLRTIFANYRYKRVLKRGLKNAYSIAAVSESTKKDILRFYKLPESRIKVIYNGIDLKPALTTASDTLVAMPTKPYLLFVGAADQRRRVEDLVDAYNNLKAAGHDIQLVLAGENFKSPEAIPRESVRSAVLKSSYVSDIITMGYISDETKQKLFTGALAFVYPTLYEGFGIPVLEAFLFGAPVVAYKNSSIPEVGGKYARYAHDWGGIKEEVEALLMQSSFDRAKRAKSAKMWAEKFSWDKTAKELYTELVRARE